MSSRGSVAWRKSTWGTACRSGTIISISFCGARIWISGRAQPAFEAMEKVIKYFGYEVRSKDTGAYNCRHIKGTTVPSSHSWGTAIDINWATNPWLSTLITDLPIEMVNAICNIRTADGTRVWRWGGDWDGRPDTPHKKYDSMHFEIVCTPEELEAGKLEIPKMVVDNAPTLREGMHGKDVGRLQDLLRMPKSDPDIFGPKTLRTVIAFQKKNGLTPDGIVGKKTWEKLLTTGGGGK